MSCKVGNKNHHDRCQKYKTRGQREINKEKKQERNKRRIAKFAARREKNEQEKKNYTPQDPETRGSNKMEKLGNFAYRPKMKHMTEFSEWTSMMRRVQNQLDAEAMELKKALEVTNKKKGSKKNGDSKKEDTKE